MWNSNDHFNASGNLVLLALYIAEDHFNYHYWWCCYAMFNIDSDEVKEMLTNEVKQSIKDIHSNLTINKEQLQILVMN